MIRIMNKDQRLREGYTTGTCAAASAKGASFGLTSGYIPDYVNIKTPIGKIVRLKILEKQIGDNFAECCVQKDAGDDPDATHGALIYCRLQIDDSGLQDNIGQESGNIQNPGSKIVICGGEGVGIVTKPGLQVGIGQSAINPVPMQMIKSAICDTLDKNESHLRAVISVPDGQKIAERTFNKRLGIYGGISIIGTTGIVRPMSDESIKNSLKCELDIAKALGFETVVLVPGNLAETAVKKTFKLKNEQVILMSNFVGFMLTEAHSRGFKEILLAGHPGKLAKLIRGDFNTHSSNSRPANEIIINIIEKEDIEKEVIDSIKRSATVEGIIQEIRETNRLPIFNKVAEIIETSASDFLKNRLTIGAVLFDMAKRVIGLSPNARKQLAVGNYSKGNK